MSDGSVGLLFTPADPTTITSAFTTGGRQFKIAGFWSVASITESVTLNIYDEPANGVGSQANKKGGLVLGPDQVITAPPIIGIPIIYGITYTLSGALSDNFMILLVPFIALGPYTVPVPTLPSGR